jgi:glycosyltransferase involved in cell wall biosynthesis
VSRIGVVYPRANLDSVPSLVATIDDLAARGWPVDVFTVSRLGEPAPRFASPGVRLRSLGVEGVSPSPASGARRAVRWLPRPARAPLRRGLTALAHGTRLLAAARTRLVGATAAYDCLIGVDPDGLVLANAMGRGRVPLGYFSLELLLSTELRTRAEQALKAQERALTRRAAFIIVQDQERGRLLAADNNLSWERLVLVPNAPPGRARRSPSRYWHQKFGLERDRRVVLHAGSLGDWTGIEDIVRSVPGWPEPWTLVVHTRYDAESSPYVDGLRSRADAERVHFSLKPVARAAYDELVDAADIGLAFYVPTADSSFTGTNVQTIGLSSGKLAYYLRAGLPVLVNRAASIAPVLEGAGAGLAVEDAHGLGHALQTLGSNYDAYSRQACAFFERHLDPRRALDELARHVEALGVRA